MTSNEEILFTQREILLMYMVLQVVDVENKPRTFSLEGQATALSIFEKIKAVVVEGRVPDEATLSFTKEERLRIYDYVKEFKVVITDIEAKISLLDKLK